VLISLSSSIRESPPRQENFVSFLAVPRTAQPTEDLSNTHLNVLDIVELNEGHDGAESGDQLCRGRVSQR